MVRFYGVRLVMKVEWKERKMKRLREGKVLPLKDRQDTEEEHLVVLQHLKSLLKALHSTLDPLPHAAFACDPSFDSGQQPFDADTSNTLGVIPNSAITARAVRVNPTIWSYSCIITRYRA
jgi:hypothetical protein